ncbi:MAG: hypothetical protein QOJ29_1596 [Thermoleophilaceae bacterium]|jgi:hypothetical protein|nr:hypothetical protein [Thermoleophilaceae bacterium]
MRDETERPPDDGSNGDSGQQQDETSGDEQSEPDEGQSGKP